MLTCFCSLAGTSACKTCSIYLKEFGTDGLNKPIPNYTNPYYQPLQTQWYEPKEHCTHCYCREFVENKLHLVCCMCGNRKLKV